MTERAGKLSKLAHGISSLPAAPTACHYESTSAAKEDADAFASSDLDKWILCVNCGSLRKDHYGPECNRCAPGDGSSQFKPAAAQTVPIPEDLRECYDACVAAEEAGCGEDCVDAKTEIILIERIARAERDKAYFVELHTKQYEKLKAELIRAEATIAELKKALKDVVAGNDLALERNRSISNWHNSDFRNQAINALTRATGKES